MDLRHDDLVGIWGPAGVLTLPSDDLGRYRLNPSTIELLTTVGIPRKVENLFAVEIDMTSPSGLQIGRGWHDEFVISVESGTGRVLARPPVGWIGQDQQMFVNTDVVAFVQFLVGFQAMADVWEIAMASEPVDDERIEEAAERTRTRLAELDPPAVDDGGWWSETLQGMGEV